MGREYFSSLKLPPPGFEFPKQKNLLLSGDLSVTAESFSSQSF